jgi:hypothetical protein
MQPPIKLKAPGWLSEFQAFIMRGSVVDLAVGIIIGAAFTGVVNSLVKDIFNPVIGLLIGGVDFSNVFFSLNGQHYASLAEAQHAGAATGRMCGRERIRWPDWHARTGRRRRPTGRRPSPASPMTA